MRDPSEEKQAELLNCYGKEMRERLSFIKADLMDSEGEWEKRLSSIEGLDGVIHVASPFPGVDPKDE
jgi:hypothetical protein